MPVNTIDHPLAQDILTQLRDQNTSYITYKKLTQVLSTLIAIYATGDLSTKSTSVTTPLAETNGKRLNQDLILVPILRAGLGMLEPIQELYPAAKTGFIGLQRIKSGEKPDQYYCNVPNNFNNPDNLNTLVLVLDPMIASGQSALVAINNIVNLGFKQIKLLSFLAAPEGLTLLESKLPELKIYTAAIDLKLNDKKYIIPGLGDFGDRLFGTTITQ